MDPSHVYCGKAGKQQFNQVILHFIRGVRGVDAVKINRRDCLAGVATLIAGASLQACDREDPEAMINRDLPTSGFSKTSTAEQVTEGLDLSGQVALVTGCNSGLGFETMRVLALRGAHVLGTGRTLKKAETACAMVPGLVTPLELELTNLDSISNCAKSVSSSGLIPQIVICNAGINTFGELELINGIEKTFFVNFLGHFVLVNNLLPKMLENEDGRFVHVSSRSAYKQAPDSGIDFDNLRGEGKFDAGEAYGRSKLANALFSLELSRRLQNTGLTSNAIHPGLVLTNIARSAPVLLRRAFELLGPYIAKTPEEGAATQVYVATNPALEEVTGLFFENSNAVAVKGRHYLNDASMAKLLWDTAEEMVGSHLI